MTWRLALVLLSGILVLETAFSETVTQPVMRYRLAMVALTDDPATRVGWR